jgi:hypothetical protein
MGALSEIFVATPAAAKKYGLSSLVNQKVHYGKYAPFTARGLTDLDLGYLWAAVEGEVWSTENHQLEACGSERMNLKKWLDSIGELETFTDLYSASSGGRMPDWSQRASDSALYRFPDEYVSLLAELAAEDDKQIATRWRSRLKRNGGSQLSQTQARNVIIALANFAEQVLASRKRKALYLWTSL